MDGRITEINCKHLKCLELTERPLLDICDDSAEGFAHYILHCCKCNSRATYIMSLDILCSSAVRTFAAHKFAACLFLFLRICALILRTDFQNEISLIKRCVRVFR